MSKKTKRLEKENLTLTRKQEATNKNIFAMAEERERNAKQMDRIQKENEKLKRLCRAMQEGGYGGKGGAPVAGGVPPPHGGHHPHVEGVEPVLGETESEYDDEEDEEEYDEDEDDEDDEDVYDDEDTEEDPEPDDGLLVDGQRAFGPPPPPPPPPPPLDEKDKPAYVLGGAANGKARGPVPLVNGSSGAAGDDRRVNGSASHKRFHS